MAPVAKNMIDSVAAKGTINRLTKGQIKKVKSLNGQRHVAFSKLDKTLLHIIARINQMIEKVESLRHRVAAAVARKSSNTSCDSVVIDSYVGDTNPKRNQKESTGARVVDNQNDYEDSDASSSTEDESFGGGDLGPMKWIKLSPASSYGSTSAVEVIEEKLSDDDHDDFVTQLARVLIPETADYTVLLSMDDADDDALVDNVGLGASYFNPYAN